MKKTLAIFLNTGVLFLWGALASCQSKDRPNEPAGSVESASEPAISPALPRVVFLGDSLTAGYGIDPASAYPARIQEIIDEEAWDILVVNAGLSGDTTSAGLERLKWILQDRVNVLVIALGANDGLRGIEPAVTQANLQSMIDLTRRTYPESDIILAGMKVPPNMGPPYTQAFSKIFPALAEKNNLILIPFLLEGVAAEPDLNLPDGIHPNEKGHKIIAETLWKTLRPIIRKYR